MSTSDDTLVLETPQGENVAGEAVDTPVHPVDQKGGAAAGTQPVEISGSEPSTIGDGGAAQVDVVSTKDPSCVLPTPQYDDGSMEYEYAEELEIDPDTYVVMQGRKQAKPNPKKIGEMVAAYDRGVVFPIPDVYQDWDTAERFAPDSGHRREVFRKKGAPIRVRIFKVKNAKKLAELHSCRANAGNGRDASAGDRRFQCEKACTLYHDEHGHYPNPAKLAAMTLARRADCVIFLREYLGSKTDSPDKPSDDEPEQRQIIAKLQKVLAGLQGVNNLSDDWIAGDEVQDVLKAIAAEARRINVRRVKEADVTPEQLNAFQREHGLTLEKFGELLGVKHTTVSRWIRGKAKTTEHHQRAVRELLSLTPDQFATIIEKKAGEDES